MMEETITKTNTSLENYISPAVAYIIVKEDSEIIMAKERLDEISALVPNKDLKIIPCTAELYCFHEDFTWRTRFDGVADIDWNADCPDQPEFTQAGWVAAISAQETYGASASLEAMKQEVAKYPYPVAILRCDARVLRHGDSSPTVDVWPGGFATISDDDDWNGEIGAWDEDEGDE